MPAEDGEEAEDLDAEEGQREDVRGAGEAGSEDGAGHEGGVGGEGGGEVRGGRGGRVRGGPRRRRLRVVEEEEVDGQQPGRHRPDAVACCGFGEGFEEGREREESEVD